MNHPRCHARVAQALLISLLGLLCCSNVLADRPFLRLETATVEDDDERNFEISLMESRHRDARTRQTQIEYNFSPMLSAELEMTSERSRTDPEREREIELGIRYVLVDHNRSDWGLALKASAEWEGSHDDTDGKTPMARAGHTLLAAFVLPLADNRVRLHANWGLQHKRDTRENIRIRGLGIEAHVSPSLVAFAEHGKRKATDSLEHAGLRWWVKKEKLAVQISSSRTRDLQAADTLKGVHVGVTFSDLSF